MKTNNTNKPDSLRTRINKAKAKKHLKLTYGNVRASCRNANISKSQFYKWFETDSEFAKQIMEIHIGIESYTVVNIHDKIQEDNLNELIKLQKKSTKRVDNNRKLS